MARVFVRNVTMSRNRPLMNVESRVTLALLATLASGCADRGRAVTIPGSEGTIHALPKAAPPRHVEKGRGVEHPVVLVTLDGVRWQEVFLGTERALSSSDPIPAPAILKNLYMLARERGAFVGAPGHGTISASGPNYVSLPGYTELLGGRASGCMDNDCARTVLPSVLDEARAAGASVAAFASWEKLDGATSASPGAFLSSCGRHGDPSIDPWPGYGDYRPDRFTADLALAHYEAAQPDVFFLGLGDTDEYAHRGDYPGYLAALRHADEIVGRFVALIDRMGERGRRTHVVVTTDHGRSNDFRNHGSMPEAARVWMLAAGPRFRARGNVVSTRPRRLADVTPTLRLVMGLAPDTAERSGTPIDELF